MRRTMRRTMNTMALAAACGFGLVAFACAPEPTKLTPEQKAEVAKADPDMQKVLDKLHSMGGKPIETLSAEEARKQPTPAMAAAAIAAANGKAVPEPVGGVSPPGNLPTSVDTPDGAVPVRVYAPTGNGPFPVLVYFHGGGWVIGSLDGYDASCRALCNKANCVVVSVDYRQAPEHKYPAAVNDCYNVTQYVIANANKFLGDGQLVAVGGESAGGNLTVAVCLMAKDKAGAMPKYMLVIYPVGGYNIDTPSAGANANAIPLDKAMLPWFYDQYLPSPADRTAKYFDILDQELHGLPPATVITASIDPLMSDGVMLKSKLVAAGVDCRYHNFEGVTHEFFGMGGVVDGARQAEEFAAEGLAHAFHTNGTKADPMHMGAGGGM